MATTQNTFTGDGSNLGPFSFTFKWLEPTDIKVTVAGVLKTVGTHYNLQSLNYTTKTGGQVLFTAGNAPANGAAIVVYRQTDDTDLAATFYSGSAIRAQDLNNNFIQGLYVTQESNNVAASATSTANTALTNSSTAISTANTALSTANTASSNASAAVTTANTANTNASAAVSTANTANTNATAAVNTANTASSDASTALSTANTALNTANTANTNATTATSTANTALSTANTAASNASAAVSTANTASSNASTALSTANTAISTANTAISTANAAASAVANAILYDIVANVAAIPASPANNDAVEVTNSTGIESFTPLTGVPGGFVGNSGLSVRLVYTTTGSTWNWIQYFPNDPETRYLKLAGGTLTGDLTVANQGDIRFGEATANGSNYVAIQAPSSLAANITYTLPSADGTSGQLLSTNGTGMLSWATASGGSSVTTSDTPPATPNDGDLWYDSVGGRTYVYYQDPNGSQWVDASPQGGGSSTSITTGNTTAEVIDTGSDGRFVVTTEGTERLRINSSGNLGLGVVPSASSVSGSTVEVKSAGSGIVATSSADTSFTNNSYYDSGWKYGTTNPSARLQLSDSTFLFYNAASGSAGSAISFTERMRIDGSGRLLVGTSSTRTVSFWDTPQVQIEGLDYQKSSLSIYNNQNEIYGAVLSLGHSRGTSVGSNTVLQNNDYTGAIAFYGSDGSNESRAAEIAAYVDGTPGANDMPGRLVFSTTADGASSPTERMRITSGGSILVNRTTDTGTISQFALNYPGNTRFGSTWNDSDSAATGYPMRFARGGTEVGAIAVSGSSTAYNTSSDYRLKENVTPVTDGITRLQQLKPSRFNFITDPDKTVDGFIAHEVQTVVPECVTGEKDAVDADGNPVYQGIDQSKLVPLLTAALQEAVARIEAQDTTIASLEARLTALEGGTN